jgi:hypothetical protein
MELESLNLLVEKSRKEIDEVYICINVSICIYICKYVPLYICINISISMYLCVYVHIYIYTNICLFIKLVSRSREARVRIVSQTGGT